MSGYRSRAGGSAWIGRVFGVAAAAALYSWRVEPHWLQIVRRSLPVAGLPAGLEGARLVHLSDLHVGPQVSDAYLRRALDRIAALSPDIVVVTGDLTTHECDGVSHLRAVGAHLPHGRLGTVAVLGNHDYGQGWADSAVADSIEKVLGEMGVAVLRNRMIDLGGLQIVGMDDLWADRFRPAQAFEGVDLERATLVLTHNPDTADLPGWNGYRGWILAGHTHGGQCRPPFLPPPELFVKNRRYTSGEFALEGDRHMYISRGVGHTLPVRFNVRPEATVFELERA